MQSKNIGYIRKLDHLRFLAAFVVLEYHADIWFRSIGAPHEWLPLPLFHRGYTGVALFMVISGFIFSVITHGKEIDAWKFYLDRALRIYPLFVFVVALGYFATPDPRETSTGVDFLMALLPISNLYRLHYGAFGGVFFSVAIELQFYLLLPALLLFVRKYGRWYIPSIIGSLIAIRAVIYALNGSVHDLAYFSIFGALDIFLIGMLAGNIYVRPSVRRFSGWLVLLAFVAVNGIIYAAHLDRSFFNYDFAHTAADAVSRSALWIVWPTVQGLMFAAFSLIYLRSDWEVPFASFFSRMGRYSYSLYAWHTLVFMAAVHLNLRFLPPFEMGALIIFPVTALIAAASYELIEKPFLALRVRYVKESAEGNVRDRVVA